MLTPEYAHAKQEVPWIITSTNCCWAQCRLFGLALHGRKKGVFEDNGITIQQIKNIKFKGLSQLTQKKD
jgi:hypothetical protein